ncbi:MAG: helix-turn-helix domain-containing protein [Rhizobiaceae bacterium]|nr:helix-turn-helix domain-containing protein [Rhizobiaceae bacterium]
MTVFQVGERQAAFHTAQVAAESDALAKKHGLGPVTAPPSSRLSSFEFATESVPRNRQFEAWRANFASILELETAHDISGGFMGKQTSWDLGCFAFSRVATDALAFKSVVRHARREPLDHFILSVLLSGDAYTEAPPRAFHGGVGVTQVHALGQSFRGTLSASETLQLFVPRDFCPQVTQALSAAEFTILDSGMGRLFHDFMVGLAKQLSIVERGDLPALVEATRAMILACVSPSAEHIEMATHPIAITLLDRAQKIIQSKLRDPTLGARTLERELGVSRSRLYRMFQAFGGVKHYIQHRRLLDAHATLANPSDQRRIFDIAEQLCFTDGTEFSRAFKREFGYSPTEVRSGKKSSFPCRQSAGLQENEPENLLGTMLRRLHG